ncbi:MAG: helix-turn-helix domain-containing protein [Dehalococcoidia bacterium]
MSETRSRWDAAGVRALRERLGVTQRRLADELGVRQQTVSEWETGAYQPRGASARLLRIVAERGAAYAAGSGQPAAGSREDEPGPAEQG